MSYERRPYAEADTVAEMTRDCVACGEHVGRLRGRERLDVTVPAPRLAYASDGRAKDAGDISVSAAAAHLASRLHLHLD